MPFLDQLIEVSLHPPHLLDSSGSLTPAALIPFCAYQTNMTLLGQKIEETNFISCSLFKPTVLEGQLCYELNLSSLEIEDAGAGKRAGLMIVLDSGELSDDETQKEETAFENTLNLEPSGEDVGSARIYLNTLSSFTASSSGSYAMTALKKMTGTESFLKLTENIKRCRIGSVEDCQAKGYIEQVQKLCGCVPWALSRVVESKV